MDVLPFEAVADQRSPATARPFTIGRLSRDDPAKHHAEDPALYRMLASRGLRVRIMGGSCLAASLAGVDGIELLPAGAESAAEFCASLDAFFYRTGAFSEAYGRVVAEAMASGLPVVVHSRGGYAEIIEDGVSGFLIRSQEEAYDALLRLAADPALCRTVGDAARQRAHQAHGPEATHRDMAYYLRAGAG
ncbi:MAG: glycosyltransferase family 1 protein [Haliea sp.]|nr:MAG: glycosyltransferase family 1 protein [Haliea sp.]